MSTPVPVQLPPLRPPTLDSKAAPSAKVLRAWKRVDPKAPK